MTQSDVVRGRRKIRVQRWREGKVRWRSAAVWLARPDHLICPGRGDRANLKGEAFREEERSFGV